MQPSTSAVTRQRARGARRRWLTDAIIAGFVAIGTSTGALMVARVIVSLRGVQLHIASIRCTPCFCNHSCNACSVVNSQVLRIVADHAIPDHRA